MPPRLHRRGLAGLVLLAAAAAGCAGSAAPSGPSQTYRAAASPVAIAYSVLDTAAGVTEAYTIDGGGHVTASRRAGDGAPEGRSYALSTPAQAQLQAALAGVDFGALEAQYGATDASCATVTTLSFVAASSRTDVVVGCGEALPAVLDAALAAVRAAIAEG